MPQFTKLKADKPSKRCDDVCRLSLALFLFSFVIQCVWTLNITATEAPLPTELFWMIFLSIFVITGIALTLIIVYLRSQESYRLEVFYRTAFIFTILGTTSLGLSNQAMFFSYSLAYIAYALITPTMWILCWSIMFLKKEPSDKVVGYAIGFQYLAFCLGLIIVKTIEWSVGKGNSPLVLSVFCLVGTFIVALSYSFILPERSLLKLSPRLFELSRESLNDRCEAIAKDYGLTRREAEIFIMLARGRDASYIEKELCISRNTVATHRSHVYKKLGIHSQQELLSLIENAMK